MEITEVCLVAVFEELEKLAENMRRKEEVDALAEQLRKLSEEKAKKKVEVINLLMFMRRIRKGILLAENAQQ